MMNKCAITIMSPLRKQKYMIRGSRNQGAGFFYSGLYRYLHGLCSAIPQIIEQCERCFAKICSD